MGLRVFDVKCNLFVFTQVTPIVFEMWLRSGRHVVLSCVYITSGQSDAELLNITAVVTTVIILRLQCDPQ